MSVNLNLKYRLMICSNLKVNKSNIKTNQGSVTLVYHIVFV